MIDIKDIRTKYSEIESNIKNRYMNVDLQKIAADMERRSELLQKAEALRARRNETAAKMKGKLDPETRNQLIAEGKAIKDELAAAEAELDEVERIFQAEVRTIPNYASPEAPVGKEDKDSLAVKFYGEPTKFSFKAKDHVELGEALDILDFDSGAIDLGQFLRTFFYDDGSVYGSFYAFSNQVIKPFKNAVRTMVRGRRAAPSERGRAELVRLVSSERDAVYASRLPDDKKVDALVILNALSDEAERGSPKTVAGLICGYRYFAERAGWKSAALGEMLQKFVNAEDIV